MWSKCIYIDEFGQLQRAYVYSEPVPGKRGKVVCIRLAGETSMKFRPADRVHQCPWDCCGKG